MLEQHQTRAGRVLLIAQMDDSHLGSTIKLHLRKLNEARSLAQVQFNDDPFERALYGVKEINPEQAGEVAALIVRKMYPYLAELVLRGGDVEITDLLRDAIGRDGPLSSQAVALPAPDSWTDVDSGDWGRAPIDHEDF